MDAKRGCNGVNKFEISSTKSCVTSIVKSFEVLVNDKKKKYVDKVQSLLSAWDMLRIPSGESPQPEFDILFINTLRFVLRADWLLQSSATRNHLSFSINKFSAHLEKSKLYPSILHQCRVLEAVVKTPWENPVLSKILKTEEEVEFFDLLEFFQMEYGKVIVVRLEMMLESRCEDLVAVLSKACLQTYYNSEPLELDMTQNEVDYITDIYYCCLLRLKKTNEFTEEIKTYELDEGLDLLRRYRKSNGVGVSFNENCKDARVWKYSKKVIALAANTLLANAVLHDDLVDNDTILQELITEWAYINRSNSKEDFSPVALEMIRKFVMIARSSKCIYPFCSFLIENCGCKELYMNYVSTCIIRAINQNMNEIEDYRVNNERHKLRETYDQLSKGFELISKLLGENVNIYKECLLTSFSLTPSREGLRNLENLIDTVLSTPAEDEKESAPKVTASENGDATNVLLADPEVPPIQDKPPTDGSPATDSVSNELTGTLQSTAEDKGNVDGEEIIPQTTEADKSIVDGVKIEGNAQSKDVSDPESMRGAVTAYCTEVERLKLDESIKIDLNYILRYQRFHALSWELEWSELKVNCEKYLEAFEQRGGFDEVELKYLDLDYNQFKDRPINEDEYCGIEKGYEHCMLPSPVYSEADEDVPVAGRRKGTSGVSDKENEYDRGKKRRVSHSSDEEWNYRKTKKMKKYKKQPRFVEYDDPSDVDELLDFVRQYEVKPLQPEKEKAPEKKKKKTSSTVASTVQSKGKKKRGRPSHSSKIQVSENSTDSQSENQPPDDLDPRDEDNVLNSTPVQKLRQFRIKGKPIESEEKDDIGRVVENNVLKLCIPKCDNEIAKHNDFDGNVGPRKSSSGVKNKSASARTPLKSGQFADIDDMFRCEVRLNKSEVNDFFQSAGIKNRVKKMSEQERMENLDEELLSFLNDSFENSAAVESPEPVSVSADTPGTDVTTNIRIRKPSKKKKKSKLDKKFMTSSENSDAEPLSMPELHDSLSNLSNKGSVAVPSPDTPASSDGDGARTKKRVTKKIGTKPQPSPKTVIAFLKDLEKRSNTSSLSMPELENNVLIPRNANSTPARNSRKTSDSSTGVNGRPKKMNQSIDDVIKIKRLKSKKVPQLGDGQLPYAIAVKSECDEAAPIPSKSSLQQLISPITRVKSEPNVAIPTKPFPRSYLSNSYLDSSKMVDKGTNCNIPSETNTVVSMKSSRATRATSKLGTGETLSCSPDGIANRHAGTFQTNHISSTIPINGAPLTDPSQSITTPVNNRLLMNATYSSPSEGANSFNSTQSYSSVMQSVTGASSGVTTPSNTLFLNSCDSSEFSPAYYSAFSESSYGMSPRLRTALQNTSVGGNELYPMQSNHEQPIKQENSEASTVHKILGEYTQALVRNPQLKNVPAPRNRSGANGAITSKRPRKCKNDPRNGVTITSAAQTSVPNSYLTLSSIKNHVGNQYSSPVSVAAASQISSLPNSSNQYTLTMGPPSQPQFMNTSQFPNQSDLSFRQSTGIATTLMNHQQQQQPQQSWMQSGGSTMTSHNGMMGNAYSQVPVTRNSNSYFVNDTSNDHLEIVNVLVENRDENLIQVQSDSSSMLCMNNGTNMGNDIIDMNEGGRTNNNQYKYNLLIDSSVLATSESDISADSTNELKNDLSLEQQSEPNMTAVYNHGMTIYVRNDGEGSAQITIPENSAFSESIFSDYFPSTDNSSIGGDQTLELSNDVRQLLYQSTNYGDQLPTYGS